MIRRDDVFDGFPSEIWQIIFTYLDLETQLSLSRLSKEFHLITSSLWRIKLVKTLRKISFVPLDFNEARTNLAMISFLNDKQKPLENYCLSELHEILCKYNHLTSLSGTITTSSSGYSFFHDYDDQNCKYLDLIHKWPRPGQKTLDKFYQGNKDLVCLSVSDCRENIESVQFLTEHCHNLQALRLLATDPLLPYREIQQLRQLRFLEVQFDSFYREHRDGFLLYLAQLSQLQVLKIHCCYGMREDHVLHILETCPSLSHLHLPVNARLTGWFLETLLENRKLQKMSNLCYLKCWINTSYVDLLTVIPQLYVNSIVDELLNLGLHLDIEFIHKKLPSFNPKDFTC